MCLFIHEAQRQSQSSSVNNICLCHHTCRLRPDVPSLSCNRTDSERIVHQRVNAVPFVLMGSNDTSVRVLCPLQASGFPMEITHEKFHQVNYGLSDIVGQYLSGEKLKGQLEIEEMLKVSC